jgi:hypothetical protein
MSQEIANKLAQEYFEITNIECSAFFMSNGENHAPSVLRNGEQGVYVFLRGELCFKVGKAGPNSAPRWSSNHYKFNGNQNSIFANTIISKNEHFRSLFPDNQQNIFNDLTQENTKVWIRQNISRMEFKISSDESIGALNLLEGLVQYRMNPIYEGG